MSHSYSAFSAFRFVSGVAVTFPVTVLAGLFLLSACAKEDAAKPAPTSVPTPGAAKPTDIAAPADVAAPPADAIRTATGLAYKVQTPGTGTEHPVKEDRVEVHYTGWTTDGKMFDSSVLRGKTAKFKLTCFHKRGMLCVGETKVMFLPIRV